MPALLAVIGRLPVNPRDRVRCGLGSIALFLKESASLSEVGVFEAPVCLKWRYAKPSLKFRTAVRGGASTRRRPGATRARCSRGRCRPRPAAPVRTIRRLGPVRFGPAESHRARRRTVPPGPNRLSRPIAGWLRSKPSRWRHPRPRVKQPAPVARGHPVGGAFRPGRRRVAKTRLARLSVRKPPAPLRPLGSHLREANWGPPRTFQLTV